MTKCSMSVVSFAELFEYVYVFDKRVPLSGEWTVVTLHKRHFRETPFFVCINEGDGSG